MTKTCNQIEEAKNLFNIEEAILSQKLINTIEKDFKKTGEKINKASEKAKEYLKAIDDLLSPENNYTPAVIDFIKTFIKEKISEEALMGCLAAEISEDPLNSINISRQMAVSMYGKYILNPKKAITEIKERDIKFDESSYLSFFCLSQIIGNSHEIKLVGKDFEKAHKEKVNEIYKKVKIEMSKPVKLIREIKEKYGCIIDVVKWEKHMKKLVNECKEGGKFTSHKLRHKSSYMSHANLYEESIYDYQDRFPIIFTSNVRGAGVINVNYNRPK